MIYSIYDTATGQILKVMRGTPDVLELNLEDCQAYVEGDFSDRHYYVEDGQAIASPEQPSELHTWDWDTKSWVEPTEQARFDHYAAIVIAKRNDLLQGSDWSQFPDVPESTRLAWQPYRQALRDITDQEEYPYNVVFPTEPSE